MHSSPVSAGRMTLSVGILAASVITTIITTGTGTTGFGRGFVRS